MVSKDLSPHLKTKIIDGSLKDVERESETTGLIEVRMPSGLPAEFGEIPNCFNND